MSTVANKRIIKELKEFLNSESINENLRLISSIDNLNNILIEITIKSNELYDPNKPFILNYKIGKDYPFSPPKIMFIGNNIPIHPHIYSNGHICLNILYDGWTPIQTISSISISIQSMLINNKIDKKPDDDELHCKFGNSNPLLTKWIFHDDTV